MHTRLGSGFPEPNNVRWSLKMSEVIIPVEVSLESLRNDVAEAGVRQYGAERRYAEFLNATLPAFWFKVEHNSTADADKPVHTEKKALYEVLKKANHTNPSTVWARVRKYAADMVAKAEAAEKVANGESIGEGEGSGNARHTRSLNLRLIEELGSLWKATKRADSLSDKERQAQTHIGSALNALGVDTATLN